MEEENFDEKFICCICVGLIFLIGGTGAMFYFLLLK
jgi:hypothetical protein